MKAPMLIDVPRARSRYRKLKAFKLEHGIFTHRCHGVGVEEPWSALAHKESREVSGMPDASPLEVIAAYCVRLEDCGLLVTGTSEADAIQKLCVNQGLRCPF